jgi:hypothetical protein
MSVRICVYCRSTITRADNRQSWRDRDKRTLCLDDFGKEGKHSPVNRASDPRSPSIYVRSLSAITRLDHISSLTR